MGKVAKAFAVSKMLRHQLDTAVAAAETYCREQGVKLVSPARFSQAQDGVVTVEVPIEGDDQATHTKAVNKLTHKPLIRFKFT